MAKAEIAAAAREHALRVEYTHAKVRDRYDADLLIAGFVDGAAWAAARRVTDDEVEQVAKFLYEHGWRGLRTWEADSESRSFYMDKARAALETAREVRA